MTPPDNTPQDAERARQQRDGDPTGGSVKVKAMAPVVIGDGKVYEEGQTFTAPLASVEQALARGLVERVERKGSS